MGKTMTPFNMLNDLLRILWDYRQKLFGQKEEEKKAPSY